MNKPSRVRMRGPLVAYRRGFTAELRRQGYSPFTAVSVLQLTTHLSRWLERQGLDAEDLTAECVGRYLAARRASGQVRRLTPRGLRPLLSYLRGLGVTARSAVAAPAATARSQLLDAFTDYLRVQRGLAPGTVVGYRQYVRTFLFERPEEESLEPRRLEPAALSAFMLAQSQRRSVGSLNNMATACRMDYTCVDASDNTTTGSTNWRLEFAGAVGLAPADQDAFSERFRDKRLVSTADTQGSFYYLDFLTRTGFREYEFGDTYEGTYTYVSTGANTADLVLEYDDGDRCDVDITFESPTSGQSEWDCMYAGMNTTGWQAIDRP